MMNPTRLMAIEVQIIENHLMIPQGLTPIYLHSVDGRMIAYVEGWIAEKEYDQNHYDLYPLSEARHFEVSLKSNTEHVDQDWYDTFGVPAKEAMKADGGLVIRER